MKLGEREIYKLYNCTISPGIAEIYSNVRVIPGFFPVHFEQHTIANSNVKVKLSLLVENSSGFLRYSNKNYDTDLGIPESNTIRREYNFPCNIKAKLTIRDLDDCPALEINKNYYRFGKFRINDFYPVGIHLRDTLILGLIKAGYIPLHGVAFASGNQGIMAVGPPGIGKTKILVNAILHGYQYIADDLTIADTDCNLYPCLGISSLAYESGIDQFYKHNIKQKCNMKMKKFISSIIPIINVPYIDFNILSSNIKVSNKAIIDKIFILKRGNDSIKKLSADEAMRLILRMNRLEFPYFGNKLLQAYSLLNLRFDLQEVMHIEEEMVRELAEKVDCYLCVASNSEDYFTFIQQIT